MDKKLKIIIFIQAFVVVFLLGILLGMNIQKKRMGKDNTTNNTEATMPESNHNNQENGQASSQDSKDDSVATESSSSEDSKEADESQTNPTEATNHVTVDRDVDYGAMDVPEPTTDDWLSVKGNKIVDKDGNEVWLTGINWFGYNTGTNTFDGLWAGDMNTSIQEIANHGFNVIRFPFSA